MTLIVARKIDARTALHRKGSDHAGLFAIGDAAVILWDIVAFLRKLPLLTPDEYKALTKDTAVEHEEMRGHGAMREMKP